MKKLLKKKMIVDWKETDFSNVHVVPKLRYQRKELIHKTVLKYLENITDHSDRNLDILWKLVSAYESA